MKPGLRILGVISEHFVGIFVDSSKDSTRFSLDPRTMLVHEQGCNDVRIQSKFGWNLSMPHDKVKSLFGRRRWERCLIESARARANISGF